VTPSVHWGLLTITPLVGEWDSDLLAHTDTEAAAPYGRFRCCAGCRHLCGGAGGAQPNTGRGEYGSAGRHSASRARCRRTPFWVAGHRFGSSDRDSPRHHADPLGWRSGQRVRWCAKRGELSPRAMALASRQLVAFWGCHRCAGMPRPSPAFGGTPASVPCVVAIFSTKDFWTQHLGLLLAQWMLLVKPIGTSCLSTH